DPPLEYPHDTRHVVDDPNILLVHVTHFSKLMWDNNRTPSIVIDHGVLCPPEGSYTGEIERGIVVINNIEKRGRRLGFDVFQQIRKHIPLDLVGMGTENLGLGEIPHPEIPSFISKYRFFFNPIRYTSLGLSVCEAMMIGMPVAGLATTEMAVTIENNVTGFVYTNLDQLTAKMKTLLEDKALAERMGAEAKKYASNRFHIERFTKDWEYTFRKVTAKKNENRYELEA